MTDYSQISAASGRARVILALIVVGTACLYAYVATLHSLHVDEAVHGRGGLAILSGDWHLAQEKAMKPPVVYYAMALFRWIGGGSDFSGRVASILAVCGSVLFLFGIGRRWIGERAALLACFLFPLGPMAVKQLHQAKTDPLMILFIVGAVYFATRRKAVWSGLWFALAFCTRQFAAVSFPLVVGVLYLAAYLPFEGEKTAPEARPLRLAWRFALGAAGPLVLLAVWSSFTKDPFAWLLREHTQSKYAEATGIGLWEKLSFWLAALHRVLPPLWTHVAKLGMLLCAALCLRGVRRGASFDAKKRAWIFACVLTGFCLLMLGFHLQPKMTLKLRYMLPLAPWLAMLAAWTAARTYRFVLPAGDAGRPRATAFRRAVAGAAVFVGLAMPVHGVVDFVDRYRAPVFRDEVPAATEFLRAQHEAEDGAVVFNRFTGPEFSYYLYGSAIEPLQIQDDLDRVRTGMRDRPGVPGYLFLSRKKAGDPWPDPVPALAPVYVATPVWDGPHGLGRLTRIDFDPRIGVDGLTRMATYVDGRELRREPFDAVLVTRIVERGLRKWREKGDPAPEVSFSICELDPADPGRVDALVVSLVSARLERMRIEAATFGFDRAWIDLDALLGLGRLRVTGAERSFGRIRITPDAVAEEIRRKNRGIGAIEVLGDGRSIALRGTFQTPLGERPFVLSGTLDLPGDGHVHLLLTDVTIDGRKAPAWLRTFAEGRINPGFACDLPELGLAAKSIAWAPDWSALVAEFGPAAEER